MLYDFIIIGGGPAGVAAAVYAARKKLRTLFITESIGGQSVVSADIQNWIGEPHISGIELAERFEKHVRAFLDIVVRMPERATEIKRIPAGTYSNFEVTTDSGETYTGRALMLAMGARRRRLGIPGEDAFDGKGVVFCSTCDAPLFGSKDVVVVGGGNAGLEAVQDLFPYANKIYLMVRGGVLKGDPVTQEYIKKNPKLEIMFNTTVEEIMGNAMVTGVRYRTGEGNGGELAVSGVFVEIGSMPNTDLVKDLVSLDERAQIIVDAKHGTTSTPGVFAAGDITDDPYKQNNISVGDAVKAALAAYNHLLEREKAEG